MTVVYKLEDSSAQFNSHNYQTGGVLPHYSGTTIQGGKFKGAGIGSVFSKALKFLTPILKSSGKTLVKSAMNIADDVLDGRTFKDSAKANLKSGGKELLGNLVSSIKSTPVRGGAKRKRKSSKRTKRSYKTKQRRLNKDIFS